MPCIYNAVTQLWGKCLSYDVENVHAPKKVECLNRQGTVIVQRLSSRGLRTTTLVINTMLRVDLSLVLHAGSRTGLQHWQFIMNY